MHVFSHDPYEVLGIARDATQREVKQAYRRLAIKFHPDRNPIKHEAETRFRQIQLAYETLTDRNKKVRAWTAAGYQRNFPSSFSVDEHPFFSFFWALKTCGARIKKDKNSSERSF
jgi:DnaJ-class molecular chaperone